MAGAKAILTSGKVTIAGTAYGIIDANFSENFGKIDLTDTNTTGDGKEFYEGRAERTFGFDLWLNTGVSGPPMATNAGIIIDFQGQIYQGSGSLDTKAIKATLDAGVKITYSGHINGAITITNAS